MYSNSRLVILPRTREEKNWKNEKLRRPGEIRQRLGYQDKGEKDNESAMAAKNFYFI